MFKKKKVVDDVAHMSDWYMASAGADAVKSRLKGQEDGSFAVRTSSSEPGNFVLSYVFQGNIKNIHIDGSNDDVRVANAILGFKCLTDLVRHYSACRSDELQGVQLSTKSILSDEDAKRMRLRQKEEVQRAVSPRRRQSVEGKRRSVLGGRRGLETKDGMDGVASAASVWKVSDVCTWLKSMDMPQYLASFKKNKIDGVALVGLTDQKLRELGVGSANQRQKLVTAIQNLNVKFKAMQETTATSSNTREPHIAPDPDTKPVATVGLIARNIDGKVCIFDVETGRQVRDIAAHQAAREDRHKTQRAAPTGRGARRPEWKAPQFRLNEHVNKVWYDSRLPKIRIQPLLESESEGSFVVRDSSSNPGCYALSYLWDGTVQHKLIEESDAGFHFKACSEIFPTICNLIYHYTMTPGLALKCCLVYPTNRVREQDTKTSSNPSSPQGPGDVSAQGTASAPWDARHLDKATALAKISKQSAGHFVIRSSEQAYAAISLIRPDGSMYNQHIEAAPGGIRLKKSTRVFADLAAFVAHYTQQSQSDLPCQLVV
eukprot:m.99810 g.99810  ORF g.99810 m.99810 type:complete len:544 (+) comp10319_c2_seq1:122-1753(+)